MKRHDSERFFVRQKKFHAEIGEPPLGIAAT
jgi:hypothetical protein